MSWVRVIPLLIAALFAGCHARHLPAAKGGGIGPAEHLALHAQADDDPAPAPEAANPPDKQYVVEAAPLAPAAALGSFTLPPGFEIQLVAAEPEIQKPIQLAFDERGRLLVTMSTGYPFGAPKGETPKDKVAAIEVDGESGAARKITVVAEDLDIPSAIEADPGRGILVASGDSVLLLRDADGDGHAEARETLYTGFRRDDTHEMTNSFAWGADGWLYAVHGIGNNSNVRDRAGRVTPVHRGNTFRIRPDGSEVQVYAPGMTNPWGLAFDNLGNAFGADCESRPLWQIVRNLRYMSLFNDADPLGWAPHITEDAHGASGFAGLAYYTADAFPAKYRDSLFLGNPLTHRVHRDRPTPSGSTHHMTRKPDFLVSSDPWFRPVDVELGPDGALYVADWYNAIISHVEVRLDHPLRDKQRGRIWRVVYRGTPEELSDPARAAEIATQFAGPGAVDWGALTYRELLAQLGARHAWKRRMAANQIMARFSGVSTAPLEKLVADRGAPSLARVEALWLLERRGRLTADILCRHFADADPLLRSAALQMAANRGKDAGISADRVLPLLQDGDATVRRDAVTLLRILAREETLAPLHAAWPEDAGDDTLLDYSFAVALRDLLKRPGMLAGLGGAAPAMAADARVVRLVCAIDTPEAAARLDTWLMTGRVPEELRIAALKNIIQYGDPALIAARFLDPAVVSGRTLEQVRGDARLLLEQETRLSKRKLDVGPMLRACADALAAQGGSGDLALIFEIAARPTAILPQYAALARKALQEYSLDANIRQWACTYLLRLDPDSYLPLALAVVRNPSERAGLRRQCAEQAGKAAATPERLASLLEALAQAPYEVRDGAFFQMATNRPNVTLLLDAIERGLVSPVYLNNELTKMQIHWAIKDAAIDERVRALTARAPSQDIETDRTIAAAREAYPAHAADVRRGQMLFEQNCLLCHRMGGVGGNRAPNLDGAGQRGLDRLLQDILAPSRDIDPKYRSSIIALRDGRYERGLILNEGPENLRLFNLDNEEIDLPRGEVASVEPVWSSPMPSNFSTLLQRSELLDLVAFLLNPPPNLRLKMPDAQ